MASATASVSSTQMTAVVTVPAAVTPPPTGGAPPPPAAAAAAGGAGGATFAPVSGGESKTAKAPTAAVTFYPVYSHAALWVMTAVVALFLLAITTNELTTTDQIAGFTGFSDDSTTRSLTLYGVTHGLWKVCYEAAVATPAMPSNVDFGGPQCASITSDKECDCEFVILGNNTRVNDVPYSFLYPVTECAKINAMRAFLVFATGASILAMILMKGAIRHEKAAVWKGRAASLFIIIAGVSGMITMSFGRDHFGDIPISNYGHSFFFIVIAWPLSFVSLVLWWIPDSLFNKEKGSIESSVTRFAATLSAVSFLFFIVAVCTPQFVYWTQAIGDQSGIVPTVKYSTQTMGLWSMCTGTSFQTNTSTPVILSSVCETLDAKCESDTTGSTVGSCSSLQSIRAMLILATIFSFVAFVTQFRASPLDPQCKFYKIGFYSGVAAVCGGFLSTAIAIDYYAEPSTHYGYSFWLCLLGWLFGVLGLFSLTWARYHEEEKFTARITRFLAWVAFLFQVTSLSMPHWVYLERLPWQADQFYKYFGAGLGRPVQYGLWEICFDTGSCKDISSDKYCSFDSALGLPDLTECNTFNGIRGAVMLSTLSTALYIFAQWVVQFGWCKVNETHARRFGAVWGIFAFFWGFVATGLAVKYFDVRTSEYAFSFWMFLAAWLVLFVSIVVWIGDSALIQEEKWSRYLQYGFSLWALIFFILSVSISELVRIDYDSSFYTLASGATLTVPRTFAWTGELDTATIAGATVWAGTNYTIAQLTANLTESRTTISHGLFYTCVHDSTGRICRVLNTDCATRGGLVVLPECDQFNAAKAFTVISLLLVAVSIVLRSVNACALSERLHTIAGVANFLALITSFVAMGTALNWVADGMALSSHHLGASGALLVIAWLITVRLTLMWNRENYSKPQLGKDGPFVC